MKVPQGWRRQLIRLFVLLVGLWLITAAALYVFQRSLIYPARTPRPVPELSDVQLVRFDARGRQGAALWVPPPQEATVVVYFHANGPQLSGLVRLARTYGEGGFGFLAVEYPGYGLLAAQSPSESALLDVAEGALAWLRRAGVKPGQVVLQGRSLGTGVAVAMAARGHGRRLVLVSPFASVAEVAAERYWFMPVDWLVKDRWDSAARAAEVKVPTLIVHGDLDQIVPYSHGVKLVELIGDARLLTIEGAGHNDIFRAQNGLAKRAVKEFCRGGLRAAQMGQTLGTVSK